MKALDDLKLCTSDFADCIDLFEQTFAWLRPTSVLEIGIGVEKPWKDERGCGQSYRAFLILCQEYGVERFLSLDIDDAEMTVDKSCAWVRDHYGPVFERGFWERIHSLDFDAERYFPNGIDLVFIDSSHDSDTDIKGAGGPGMTYLELDKYAKLVSPFGIVMLHDSFEFYQARHEGVNVSGAVELFLKRNKNWYAIEHNTQTGLIELRRK